MADSSAKIRARLSALNGSLDELEAQLEPLLAQSLPETLVGLDTLQQAKLQVAIPYLVYDLVFIYLKTRGIDPKTHKVIQELDRIRQYFDKIKEAEEPAKRKMALDKGAANRFIKNAIASIKTQTQRPPGQDEGMSSEQLPESVERNIPIRVTSKMVARAQYEKELKEQESEEEEGLEVFGDEEGMDVDERPKSEQETTRSDRGKGKARATDTDGEGTKKRRRVAMDPFDGYGDERHVAPPRIDTSARQGQMEKSASASRIGNVDSGRSTPMSGSEASSMAKKTRKKKKKNRKGSTAMLTESPLDD